MPDLKIAVAILGVVIVCCGLVSLGAYFGKRMSLGKLLRYLGVGALAVIIIYVIYAAIFLLTGN
jgi:hypothetical protein